MDFSFFELLQLNDATFPIGSYTFSWGLETFVQQGIIHDSKSAEVFIGSELSGSFLYSDLLAVRLAWEAGGVGKANEAHSANCTGNVPEPNNASLVCTVPSWQKLQALDEIYGASRGPFELREGSRKLATRFEKTTDAFCEIPLLANGTHGENSTGRTSEMHGAKTAAYQAVYFPVAYGAHCAERGIPLEECLAAFTYSQVSARVTTCVKLVPLSQSEGQRILYSLMKKFSDIVAKCFTLSENDLCRSSPGLDLRAMQHEYLYSRLYSN